MIAILAWGLAASGLLVHLASALLAAFRYWPLREVPLRREVEAVSLLRPVRGVDAHDPETLRSSFELDYPAFEVIFCAHTADDPAVALVQRLMEAHPTVSARLLVGEDVGLRNPKLQNLSKGWQRARYDRICIADANLHLPPDYLNRVFAAWGSGTGMVSSPACGVEPSGFAGHLECAFLNGNQARLQLAIDSLGKGFAQGKTMAFNRRLLEQAGGLAALDQLMAEDVNATRLMRRLGLRVSLTHQPFAQPVGHRNFMQVWHRQVRWAQVRREGFPLLYMAEPLNGAVLPALGCVFGTWLCGTSGLSVPAFLALWYGTEAALSRWAGWPMGWRDLAVAPLRDLMLPAIWLVALYRRSFDWRGTIIAPAEDGVAA